MKIAIFTDIHGNYEALKSIIEDTKKEKITNIICLGDTIGIGPKPKECLDLIIKANISMILGNHELYYLLGSPLTNNLSHHEKLQIKWVKDSLNQKQYDYLKECPLTITKRINNKELLFTHFLIKNPQIPKDNSLIVNSNQDIYPFHSLSIIKNNEIDKIIKTISSDYIFIGHEHNHFEKNIDNKKLICLGSSGCIKNSITKYTILDFNKETITISEKELLYNRNNLINDFIKVDYPCKKELAKMFFDIDL